MENWMILAAALAPAVILLYYIYRKDKFQQEPVKELLKAFGYGVLSVFVSLAISLPLGALGFYVDDPLTFGGAVADSFFGAAIPEEIAKFLMFWLLIRKSRYFDEHMDGIVYASCVALGFAGLENILYLFSSEDWVSTGIMRAIFAVPGHFFNGILMGYYYSLVRFDPLSPRRNRYLILIAPIMAHGIYNSILSVIDIAPSISVLLMIAFVVMCNELRKYCSKRIQDHLRRDGVI
jgi:RsiW-degrading membrane proteinase PrsW (M82 family)